MKTEILETLDLTHLVRCGRYLVAVRDIQAGEVLLAEEPLQWGPNNTNSVLVCVGCCRSLPVSQCPACLLPVCSQECQQLLKHRQLECPIFQQHKHHLNFRWTTCWLKFVSN